MNYVLRKDQVINLLKRAYIGGFFGSYKSEEELEIYAKNLIDSDYNNYINIDPKMVESKIGRYTIIETGGTAPPVLVEDK